MSLSRMTDDQLANVWSQVRQGIEGVIRGQRWEFSTPEKMSIYRSNPIDSKVPQFGLFSEANEEQAILWAVVELVLEAGFRLRVCGLCQTTFVANQTQEYCSAACSQKMRNFRAGRIKDPRVPQPTDPTEE